MKFTHFPGKTGNRIKFDRSDFIILTAQGFHKDNHRDWVMTTPPIPVILYVISRVNADYLLNIGIDDGKLITSKT